MPRITVLGGTGYAGEAIVKEAVERGHQVTAVARREPREPVAGSKVVAGDVTDGTLLKELAHDTDVVILALSPRGDMQGRVREVVQTLVSLAMEAGVRIGVIGGAGSLKVSEDGPRLLDTAEFPEEFKPEALELTSVWERLQETDESLDWFYVSPAAGFGAYNPGQRRGTYRLGGDVLLTDDDGASDLSAADLALAVVDEIEKPQHQRTRFAVAY